MSVDFKGMHTAIKESIESSGFKYVPLNNWVNLQRDIFPANWKGRGFSIRFYVDSNIDGEGLYDGVLRINLEFALDAVNDNYLDQMDDMMTAVTNLFDALTDAGFNVISISDNHFTFTSENILDTLFVTFDQIQCEFTIS